MQLNRGTARKMFCASVLAVALSTAVGCSQPMSMAPEAEDRVTPTEYMAAVNATSEELKDKLTEFAEAVVNGDTFTMESKSYEAHLVIERLKEIEAPEELAEAKEGYEQATADLEAALVDYVVLYSELAEAQRGASFDYSTYADRIEQIQKQYDDGLTALEEADAKATGDAGDSSSSAQASAGKDAK